MHKMLIILVHFKGLCDFITLSRITARPSASMEQPGSPCKDFHDIWNTRLFFENL